MGRIYFRYIDHQIKNDRKLITSVRSFPVIYNASDPSYGNRSERTKIWEQIAQNLKTTAKKCEERWNKLIEMYKFKAFSLHDALLEIMDQFMNLHIIESKDTVILTYEEQEEAVGLSAQDSEEQIDLEQLICSELMEDAVSMSLLETDLFSNNDKLQVHSNFEDSFLETEDVLELYEDFSHSV